MDVSTGAGISANGSAFNTGGADPTNVSNNHSSTSGQAAILQDNGSIGTFNQSLSGFFAGTVTISFKAEGRTGGANPFTVTLDGTPFVFTTVPAGATTDATTHTIVTPVVSTTAFQSFTSDALTVTAGSHTLTFTGTGPSSNSDLTTFIDSVSLNNVPEPASMGLLAVAGLGLIARRRRA